MTDWTIIVCMTPCQLVFARRDVTVSRAAAAGPPTFAIRVGVLDCVWVVLTGDTVATSGFLVDKDVGDVGTLELLEPLLDLIGVDGWGESRIGRPGGGVYSDWK